MSISRRTAWLGLYTYADTGIEGVPVDTWTLQGAYWGRVDDVRGRQTLVRGLPEARVDSVIQFSDEVVLPSNGVVVNGNSIIAPTAYHIRYVVPREMHRVSLVYAERIDRNVIDVAGLIINGAFILDGSMILNGVGV